MREFLVFEILKYMKKRELKIFSLVKNANLCLTCNYYLIRFVKLKRFYELKELIELNESNEYRDKLNLIFLNSNEGKYLLEKLKIFWMNSRLSKPLYLENSLYNDIGMEFLSKFDFRFKDKVVSTLILDSNNLTYKSIPYLIDMDLEMDLTSLSFYENKLCYRAMEYLSKSNFVNLRKIDLGHNSIGDKGLEFLIKCDFKVLSDLILDNNNITAIGIEYLSNPNFYCLSLLSISLNNIMNKGLQYLSKCNYKNLKFLRLIDTKITEEGVQVLEKCNFKNLIYLNVSLNNFNDDKSLKYIFCNATIHYN